METNLQYKLRKERVKAFFTSTKLKGVRRKLSEDEFFESFSYKKGDFNVI